MRANLVVVAGGRRRLWYGHWLARDLEQLLLAGPDLEALADGLTPVPEADDPAHWLDDVWAEGGVVADVDRRVLTWFSWHREAGEAAWSHAGHAVAAAWPGWTVVWAFDAVGDLLRAAGVIGRGDPIPENIRPSRCGGDEDSSELYPWIDDGGPIPLLVSVADQGSISWFGAWQGSNAAFCYGPDRAGQGAAFDPENIDQLPVSGLHLEMADRRAYVWTVDVLPGIAEQWRACWPDWELTFGGARWEVHADLAGETAPEVLRG